MKRGVPPSEMRLCCRDPLTLGRPVCQPARQRKDLQSRLTPTNVFTLVRGGVCFPIEASVLKV